MKIVIFKGGLGNQIFQFVIFEYLKSLKFNNIFGFYDKKALNHGGLLLNKCFSNLELPKSNFISNLVVIKYKIIRKILGLNKIDKKDEFKLDSVIYDGYWQNLKYFSKDIHKKLIFKKPSDKKNLEILDIIKSTNSISVHIRRGDYLNNISVYGNICTSEYYNKAINLISQKVKDPEFFFFSDDINWVKENLEVNKSHYIDWNHGDNSYIDMYLMTQCKHIIIANSTFSWWGAYLNNNDNKVVVCPHKWFNEEINEINLIPVDWIKI